LSFKVDNDRLKLNILAVPSRDRPEDRFAYLYLSINLRKIQGTESDSLTRRY